MRYLRLLPPPARLRLGYAVILVLGLLLGWKVAYQNLSGWGVDFNQFYAASHLAGTGQLYNWDALQSEESKTGLVGNTARLPVVAYGVKAISWLPFEQAHWVWVIASAAALVLMVIVWPRGNIPITFLVLAWSMPAALSLLLGQDTPFWLFFLAAGFALLQRGRATLAGIVLALCLCKFHLAAGIPIVLVARRCWHPLLAGAVTTVLLLCSCFLIEGAQWPARYLAIFDHPRMSPAAERMPNFRGLAHWTPWPHVVEGLLAILFIWLLWLAARRVIDTGLLAALAAAGGLLLAPHGYGNDCLLLIPFITFWIAEKGAPEFIRVWAILMMSPAPLLVLASDKPLAGQIMISGFVVAGVSWAWKAGR
jgi:hypothetical protein